MRGFLLTPAGPDNRPLSLGCLTVPSFEFGGQKGVGQLDLVGGEAAAQSGKGVVVRLRSSHPRVVQVPTTVRVSANCGTATFPIRTRRSGGVTIVRITASAGGVTQVRKIIVGG